MYRSTTCQSLRKEDIGQTVTLAGWVNTNRDQGGVIFIDLRDREGITQVVFRPEENAEVAAASHKLRREDVIQIVGQVSARLPGTENARLETGEIEVVARELHVLNKADVPPFPLDDVTVNEDLRLAYRYLDLRTSRMQRNLRLRHRITKTTRDYFDEAGFIEIETPVLSNPTPEGARDFLVPSRLTPGSFYALPQAPQQYKQLLQVAGLEKYFQIARCFRDEDLRADRQPEFTQIDVEASFITDTEIQTLIEGLLARIFKEAKGVDIPTALPADDVSGGHGSLRLRQAGYAVWFGDDRLGGHLPRIAIQGVPRGRGWRRRDQGDQCKGCRRAAQQGAAQEVGGMGKDRIRRQGSRLHQMERRAANGNRPS